MRGLKKICNISLVSFLETGIQQFWGIYILANIPGNSEEKVGLRNRNRQIYSMQKWEHVLILFCVWLFYQTIYCHFLYRCIWVGSHLQWPHRILSCFDTCFTNPLLLYIFFFFQEWCSLGLLLGLLEGSHLTTSLVIMQLKKRKALLIWLGNNSIHLISN